MEISDKINAVLAHLDKDELVKLTSDLVKINSVWDPDKGTGEAETAAFILEWAKAQGLTAVMEEVEPGRPNVIITLEGSPGQRCLMLEGHTDVVTVGDPSAWTKDPFGAEIVGDRMYGRGVNDMKSGLAAALVTMAAIKRSGVEFTGKIIGGVLCDEEGGMIGINSFIDNGWADQVTAAVICEPEDNWICATQKGGIRAKFTIKGRQCHGCMPLSGLAVAPAAAKLINGAGHLEMLAVADPGRDEMLGWPSFTPTVIQAPSVGPAQLNVVPAEAIVLIDIRTVMGQNHDRIIADLEGLARKTADQVNAEYAALDEILGVDRAHDLTVSLEILTNRPCTLTDRDDPIVRSIHRAVEAVQGREPVYAGVPGATDGTFLWSRKNIPIVTIGPGDREVPHQVDEWVSLDQVYESARIYVHAALDYLTE